MIAGAEQHALLTHVLKFATGHSQIPPTGLTPQCNVSFIAGTLPTSSACFGIIQLPINCTSEEHFYHSMDKGILFSQNYYGLE